jgi:hypothetical protein
MKTTIFIFTATENYNITEHTCIYFAVAECRQTIRMMLLSVSVVSLSSTVEKPSK